MSGKGVILLFLLFIMSAVLIIPSAESSNAKAESAPMPTWNVGDMWNYSFSMNAGDINGDINVSIVKLETITVNSNEYDVYNVSAHYEYSGTSLGMNVEGSTDIIDYYCRSDTSTVKEILTVNETYDYGTDTYTYYNRTTTTYNPPEDSNQFPIEVGESWSVTTTAHINWYYELTGYPSQSGEGDSAISYDCACVKTESVCVFGTTYSTFVINTTREGTNHTSYYSPDVRNTVKYEMYDETGGLTTEMDLVSYSIGATPTRSVSGTVKDVDNNPVSGATVTARYTSNNTEAGITVTDATGEYTISNLPADTYNITASKSGYISSYQIVDLTASSASNIDFTLNTTSTAGAITGHVYISGTTTGISDANVSINATTYAITDANGAYTLSGIAQGTHTVTASAAGYASSSASVSVTAGQTSFCNFNLTLLSETGNITGVVKDENNNTISGATVTADGYSNTTDTNGSYAITGLPAGTYNVTASKTGYVSSTQTNVNVTAKNTTELNFVLTVSAEQQRGSISGTVKDKNGNPVSGATVKAYNASNMVAGTAYTNATGEYTLSNLLPGTYTIKVSKAGFQEYSMSVTLGANQNLTSENAELTAEIGGGEGGAGIADYWWVAVVICVIIVVLVVLKKALAGRRMPVPRGEMPAREEIAPEKPVEKRFCIKCGREISKTAVFCPYCGYRFKK